MFCLLVSVVSSHSLFSFFLFNVPKENQIRIVAPDFYSFHLFFHFFRHTERDRMQFRYLEAWKSSNKEKMRFLWRGSEAHRHERLTSKKKYGCVSNINAFLRQTVFCVNLNTFMTSSLMPPALDECRTRREKKNFRSKWTTKVVQIWHSLLDSKKRFFARGEKSNKGTKHACWQHKVSKTIAHSAD